MTPANPQKTLKSCREAILVGGMIYESQLLGLPINLEEAKALINSQLDLNQDDAENLTLIAKNMVGLKIFYFSESPPLIQIPLVWPVMQWPH